VAALRALLAAALLWPALAAAQLEHEVKAAYLFRFLSFVEWPAQAFAGPAAPLEIGVLDADSVRASLAALTPGRSVQGRPVRVRALKSGERPAGLHMVFVGREAAAQIARLAATQGLLVVAESDGALEQGAMVNFLYTDGRIRFEAAPEHAERRGLRISSRMLAVAQHVRQGKP
jgi:hypothetical protein